jgi:hypothetical protein
MSGEGIPNIERHELRCILTALKPRKLQETLNKDSQFAYLLSHHSSILPHIVRDLRPCDARKSCALLLLVLSDVLREILKVPIKSLYTLLQILDLGLDPC